MTYYLCACGVVINSTDRHDSCPKNVLRVDTIPYEELGIAAVPDPPEGLVRFFSTGCPPEYVVETPWKVTHHDHVLINIGIGTVQLASAEARKFAAEILAAADRLDKENS